LQGSVHILAQSPNPDADTSGRTAVMADAASAKAAAVKATGPKLDNVYHTEQQLQRVLEEPITNVEHVLTGGSIDALNQVGQGLCNQFSKMAQKFPLKAKSPQELSIEEFNGFFAPKTGALWVSYDQKLSKHVTKVGNNYQSAASATVNLNPAFLSFFNRMSAVTEAFYPSGESTPKFSYSLNVLPNNVEGLILTIGKEAVTQEHPQNKFTWSGAAEDIRVTAGKQTLRMFSGPWAAFRFVYTGSDITHSRTNLRWNLLQSDGSPITINGQQEFYAYQLQAGPPSPFDIVNVAGIHCDARVVH